MFVEHNLILLLIKQKILAVILINKNF